jgi:hypothetical protein
MSDALSPTSDTAQPAYLTLLSPLEAAGLRLDAAIIRFELAGAFATLSPEGFGDAEDEYLAAHDAYRELLQQVTATDTDSILRRLAR